MIRRALIVTLTFSASMCAVAGIASLTYPFVCTAGDPRGGLIAGSVWLMARSGFDDGAPHCFAADKDGPIFWKPELLRDGQGIAAVILPLWIPFVAFAAYQRSHSSVGRCADGDADAPALVFAAAMT